MPNTEKLFEETILENVDLVSQIKNAVLGETLSADQFKEWLDQL